MSKLEGTTMGGRRIFVSQARPSDKRAQADAPERGRSSEPPKPAPGFVERRSGRDRRKGWGPQSDERRSAPSERKPWADKKPFGDRKPFGEKKPWGE
jgi:ATP-dependent RNA helicase DeaD